MSVRRPWARRAARVLAAIGVVVAVLSVKVLTSARAELAEGHRWLADGSVGAAITHYRRAGRWYLPVNPYADEALDALDAVGEEAEAGGDFALALSAHRSVRAAIEGSRSFYVPNRERLARADEHIASLMARVEVPPVDATHSEEERREIHLALLREDRDPSVLWALLALVGLGTWVAGALLFASRALDENDRIVGPEARRWGTMIVLGLCLFVLGLALA